MNIDIQEARRLIMLVVKNNLSGVDYPRFDRIFVRKMPEVIFGDELKLIPLLHQMVEEGILQYHNNGSYIKGSNFPDNF